MDEKTKKFCGILNELENEIFDIGWSLKFALLELDKYYEDTCYDTQVIVHEDFTATVQQHKKIDEDLPSDEKFTGIDKDFIPESKCWNLPKHKVLPHLAAIISQQLEGFLSKMKSGIDVLVKMNVTCTTAVEFLGWLKFIYDGGKSVSTEFKQLKAPERFVGDFKGYLSNYCDTDKIGARFAELRTRMDFEPVKPAKTKTKKKRTRKIKITDEQKYIWEQVRNGATEAQLAKEKKCSITNIRQQYKKTTDKLKKLYPDSRSVNLKAAQRIPTDKRGQEIL